MIIFILFYNKIFVVTFDEDFSKAAGTNANAYNLLIAVVIAVIIVLAMNLVGSLLISALVIFRHYLRCGCSEASNRSRSVRQCSRFSVHFWES